MVKTSPFNAGSVGSVPGQGTKIPHDSWPKNKNMKQKQYCDKFDKDFLKGPCPKKCKNPYSTLILDFTTYRIPSGSKCFQILKAFLHHLPTSIVAVEKCKTIPIPGPFPCGYFPLSLFSEICGPGVNHFPSSVLILQWPSLSGNSPFISEKCSVVCPSMFSFWNPIIQILDFLGWSSPSFHLFTQLSRIYSSLHLSPGLILSLFYGMSCFCSHLELLRVLFYFLNVPF